jgi:hypothetical protein
MKSKFRKSFWPSPSLCWGILFIKKIIHCDHRKMTFCGINNIKINESNGDIGNSLKNRKQTNKFLKDILSQYQWILFPSEISWGCYPEKHFFSVQIWREICKQLRIGSVVPFQWVALCQMESMFISEDSTCLWTPPMSHWRQMRTPVIPNIQHRAFFLPPLYLLFSRLSRPSIFSLHHIYWHSRTFFDLQETHKEPNGTCHNSSKALGCYGTFLYQLHNVILNMTFIQQCDLLPWFLLEWLNKIRNLLSFYFAMVSPGNSNFTLRHVLDTHTYIHMPHIYMCVYVVCIYITYYIIHIHTSKILQIWKLIIKKSLGQKKKMVGVWSS